MKRRAIQAHQSQYGELITDDPTGFRLPPALLSVFDVPLRDLCRAMTASRSADHFARIYDASQDPWGFGSSPYEQGKYDRTIENLGGRRFAAGLEIGCSIGVLTRRLAAHCDTLLGLDLVEQPLQAARARCADLPGVRFQQMQVPGQWPDGRFDLMVFSEVLYFLTPADIEALRAPRRRDARPRRKRRPGELAGPVR